jgi:lipopolysaccharide heptosyltransferase II
MKILIIRFSSFGDVLQSLSVAGRLGEHFPGAEIHWVTRQEFVPLIEPHPKVEKVWALPRKAGFSVLKNLSQELKRENFTHVYDAHNNLRSRIIGIYLKGFLNWRVWTGKIKFLRRSIYRWRRFLLFRFHKNLFPKPFSGQFALLEPLKKWGVSEVAPPIPQLFLSPESAVRAKALIPFSQFVTLAPSASFELKRWPVENWINLVQSLPDINFIALGGPEDAFIAEIEKAAPSRVLNLAGKLSLEESAQVVAESRALVSNDTGLMHVAEQMGLPCIALLGPAPFGYPSRELTKIFALELWCRPCRKHGQGRCINPEFQKCLRGISVLEISRHLRGLLDA